MTGKKLYNTENKPNINENNGNSNRHRTQEQNIEIKK